MADFGLSRDSDATAASSLEMYNSLAAPELSSGEEEINKRTDKSDIYAFGCLYYEVCDPSVKLQGLIMLYVPRSN